MAIQISPGVSVSEIDQTTVVPSILTTAGAFVGNFSWGPANQITTITDEVSLVNTFGKPYSNTSNVLITSVSTTSFLTAASFLAYGNNLKVVRAKDVLATNAIAVNPGLYTITIPNQRVYQDTTLYSDLGGNYGPFAGRYPGYLGNSLAVSIVDANTYSASWNVNGYGVSQYFNSAPGTSAQAAYYGSSNDEVHIVVVDIGGAFSGKQGTVLETYPFLSKATNLTDSLGNSNWYKQVLLNNSRYIYALDPPNYSITNTNWNKPASNNYVFTTLPTVSTSFLIGGQDNLPSDANTITAFSYFQSPEDVDISLVITGAASNTVQQYVIDNIVNARKDCVAFISPPSSAVVNQSGSETTNITTWYNNLNRTTSYAVADSGWKYMFNKYNNTYQYVPLNGDIAGLCVYTDSVRDPWYSPAGLNRGALKNVVRLAWNPKQTDRDTLYSKGINSVVSLPGQGTVLYGDKTLQSKPSAFDRINVRRLFIVLEKAISTASKYSLFEFNDDFTRADFVAMVTPFLRDVQGRRGITDFRVVCDTTNNTPQVIDANQFVGDIYIKPARSINYIQLNFVAVRTGVNFTTVVGASGQ
jgi:hypothetical protein